MKASGHSVFAGQLSRPLRVLHKHHERPGRETALLKQGNRDVRLLPATSNIIGVDDDHEFVASRVPPCDLNPQTASRRCPPRDSMDRKRCICSWRRKATTSGGAVFLRRNSKELKYP